MGQIPLRAGVVGIPQIFEAPKTTGFAGHTTLEVFGEHAVLASARFLESLESKL